MSVFGAYSRYYDLLYRDKDYQREADYIATLINTYSPNAKRLLELGCGTGHHASLLAQKGFSVHGVDLSQTMLEGATKRKTSLPKDIGDRLSFSQGNVQNCKVESVFDVIISLFHVVSYQTSNEALLAMLNNAAKHLHKGGVFIFDYWYGPAVLTDRPEKRTKTMESDDTLVTRHATPTLHAQESVVNVHYDIHIKDKASNAEEYLREDHPMRYLFSNEIDLLAQMTGFKVINSVEWLTDNSPGFKSWGVVSILQK